MPKIFGVKYIFLADYVEHILVQRETFSKWLVKLLWKLIVVVFGNLIIFIFIEVAVLAKSFFLVYRQVDL